MSAVQLSGIHKSYPGQEVLRDLTLTVDAGEVVSICGVSGTGKSTLLNILGLLDTADDGEYHLLDASVTGLSRSKLSKMRARSLGFVFQGFHLLPEFSVEENILMAARCAGKSPAAYTDRVQTLLNKVGLKEKRSRPIQTLSGGEAQRVALCRALLLQPPVILADEPTGNLDPSTATVVFGLLLELARESNSAVIIVTHDPDQAARADRRYDLYDGKVQPVAD